MMDIPMMDSYLESLAGYICDEDKLVTYKWLSKELEVHVNVSKIILWRYWQNHKNDVLVATFMLIGNLKEGGMRVEVVRDRDLDQAKEKFEKIISEHVYSLQKTLGNIEMLASCGRGDSRYSAITCKKSIVMSEEEVSTLRWGKVQLSEDTTVAKKAIQQAPSKKEHAIVKETPKMGDSSKESDAKSEEKVKKVSPPSKPKNIEKKGIGKKAVQSTKAGFGNLFGKSGNQPKPRPECGAIGTGDKDSKNSEMPAKDKATEKEDRSNVVKNRLDSSCDQSKQKTSANATVTKPEKVEPSSIVKNGKTSKSKKSSRGTKRGRSQDSGDDKKKRKRIIVASDSSEESETGSADEDMFESTPPPPSPIKDKSPSPSPVKGHGNKRKVRKLVDKTFMDDNGYLITKKVDVYESCSDEEPEVVEPKKKLEAKKPKETNKAPLKMKQTSLMSFLKKG